MWTLIDRLFHRILRQVLFLVMSSFLALAAIGVGTGALYYWLLTWVPRPGALGLVALVLAGLAVVLALTAKGGKRARSARKAIHAESPAASTGALPTLATLAAEAAGDAVKADPLGAMLSASAIGFILESRPDIDQVLLQQILRQFTR